LTRMRVCSREDCHSWARSPFARFPLRRWESVSVDRCRLPTSAKQIRRTGTLLGAVILHPHPKSTAPRRVSFLVRSSSDRFRRNEPSTVSQTDSALNVPDSLTKDRQTHDCQRGWPQETYPGRQSRVKGPRIARATLLQNPAEHSVSPTRCRERFGVSSAAPRMTASFGRQVLLGFSCWPRSSFRRPPAKDDAFLKTGVLSTASSSFWVPEDRSPCPLGLGLLVTPPHLVLRLGGFLLFGVALQSGSTSAFLTPLVTPKP